MTQRTSDMHPFADCDYYPEVSAQAHPGKATDFTIRILDADGEVVETQTATGRSAMRDLLRDRMNYYRKRSQQERAQDDNHEEDPWD